MEPLASDLIALFWRDFVSAVGAGVVAYLVFSIRK